MSIIKKQLESLAQDVEEFKKSEKPDLYSTSIDFASTASVRGHVFVPAVSGYTTDISQDVLEKIKEDMDNCIFGKVFDY